jgi:hypothetical protein
MAQLALPSTGKSQVPSSAASQALGVIREESVEPVAPAAASSDGETHRHRRPSHMWRSVLERMRFRIRVIHAFRDSYLDRRDAQRLHFRASASPTVRSSHEDVKQAYIVPASPTQSAAHLSVPSSSSPAHPSVAQETELTLHVNHDGDEFVLDLNE